MSKTRARATKARFQKHIPARLEGQIAQARAALKGGQHLSELPETWQAAIRRSPQSYGLTPQRRAGDQTLKKDAGKVPLDLLPFEAVEAVGQVLAFGAAKYSPNGWRRGMEWSRLLGAALRHTFAWGRGQDKDPETGLPHLAHAACCLLFLLEYQATGNGTDDRFKGKVAP